MKLFTNMMWKFFATIAVSIMPYNYSYKGIIMSWWQWLFLLLFYRIIWVESKN